MARTKKPGMDKKSPVNKNDEKKKARKKARTYSFNVSLQKYGRYNFKLFQIYIYKILKQVYPDIEISSKTMVIMNSFVIDIMERLATEASRLMQYSRRSTISSREFQSAVRLVIPGELGKHAVSEGMKAVQKYAQSS